jgi:1,2-diacylglycerol 3-beta-galactosyltransferase
MPKKILILISDTGGGHRASAQAIDEALAHLYGDEVSVHIVDAWKDHSPWPINQLPHTYSWLVSDGLWLWNALWKTDGKAWPPRVLSSMVTPLARRSLVKMFCAEAPDLVVCVHPLLNHVSLRVLRKVLHTDVPYVTVVTDMVTAHPSWFCPQVDYCLVPTAAARQRGLRYRVPAGRVEIVGQPVGLKFAAGIGEKLELRRTLGLELERATVLVVGGGEGMGPVYETARCIAARLSSAQLIVVAGRNRVLRQMLEAAAWEIPTRIYGFVDNMPELMGASDVLVTKAGPGTLSEAFIAGLPVVISSFLPGQEEGNVGYVLKHEAGVFAPSPDQVAGVVAEWLQPGNDALERMARNAARLARPEAALNIARRLYDFAKRPSQHPIASRAGMSCSTGTPSSRRFRWRVRERRKRAQAGSSR